MEPGSAPRRGRRCGGNSILMRSTSRAFFSWSFSFCCNARAIRALPFLLTQRLDAAVVFGQFFLRNYAVGPPPPSVLPRIFHVSKIAEPLSTMFTIEAQ